MDLHLCQEEIKRLGESTDYNSPVCCTLNVGSKAQTNNIFRKLFLSRVFVSHQTFVLLFLCKASHKRHLPGHRCQGGNRTML